MRKLALLITLGLFMNATAANACDGDKATKAGKGKKASAACMKACKDAGGMKDGKCNMTAEEMAKSGCCMHGATAAKAGSKAGCDMKAAAGAKHDCCKGKAESAPKS